MNRTRFLALAFFVVFAPAATAQQGLEGLGAEIEQMIGDWGIPGAAVAVIQDDEITFAQGFGVREIGGGDPVDEHTIFAVGSTSKAFTAASIAMLVDEGKVSWDDPIGDHVPIFQLSDPYITRDLRVRDLMAHNSGLMRGDRLWYASGRSREEVLEQVRHQPVTFPLRSTFQYNNTTWIAAGEVIENASGMSWDDFVASRIFRPLGMTRSTTSVEGLKRLDNVATPHNPSLDGEVKAIPYRNIDNAGPAGSINSSALQMAQWIRLQLGRGEFEGERLISDEAIGETHTSQMLIRKEGTWALTWPESDFLTYGLGWFLSSYRDVTMISHGGNIDGMTAYVGFVPRRGYGMVILSNLSSANGFSSALAHRIIDRLEEGEGLPWHENMLKVFNEFMDQQRAAAREVEESRAEGTSTTLPVAEYAGTYANDMYGEIAVTEDGGVLSASFGAGYHGSLEHWHYDTFRISWGGGAEPREFLRFEIGTDGKVAVLHAEIEGSIAFRRQEG
ncbi:MAG: serine hydrolase [Gemmatimonadota bacterium]|nr:serine hydrolase [Gemmatimonadota bacterium]MDE2865419.1 serine hydrolase [Gemmatimonadota bacterium]MYB06719.1 serine hydrolase [Gemmatimonadota bacterium]MYG22458.1 serine hydrolase [Gemmatimonadota bacterium]MYJ39568.1 serine hydrolase [Gemmatimonadota bacterium]